MIALSGTPDSHTLVAKSYIDDGAGNLTEYDCGPLNYIATPDTTDLSCCLSLDSGTGALYLVDSSPPAGPLGYTASVSLVNYPDVPTVT